MTLVDWVLLFSSYLCFVEDLNWNALEWDRAAEELTWERVGPFYSPVSSVCSAWTAGTQTCVTIPFCLYILEEYI